MEGQNEPNERTNGDPSSDDVDAELWEFDEDDEEFIAALEAEEAAAVELLREAVPELRDAEPPSAELEAASKSLRAGITGGEWPYEHVALAAGWERTDLPVDDVEIWLGAVGGLVSPREDMGLDPEEEASIMALEVADWLGAVIGLVREGIGAPASPQALVSYINTCPEVEGEINPEDAVLVG